MNEKLVEINEKLDTCTSMFIECYQNLLTQRELLSRTLDDGYLNLSKARSLVGCSNLSILQVPTEIEAKVKVETKSKTNQAKTDDPKIEFEYDASSYDLIIDSENNKKEVPLPTWFGVLTPLSLKTSQKSFFRSLNLVTSICESQDMLKSLEKNYQDLLNEKNKLVEIN